ncbi:Hypothetical protein PBC10988_11130 [Planctomycetales bacterium 10988]|nr:Hypothetical protein PBC10988_11130 [Planctomycetales bacterium 10988]
MRRLRPFLLLLSPLQKGSLFVGITLSLLISQVVKAEPQSSEFNSHSDRSGIPSVREHFIETLQVSENVFEDSAGSYYGNLFQTEPTLMQGVSEFLNETSNAKTLAERYLKKVQGLQLSLAQANRPEEAFTVEFRRSLTAALWAEINLLQQPPAPTPLQLEASRRMAALLSSPQLMHHLKIAESDTKLVQEKRLLKSFISAWIAQPIRSTADLGRLLTGIVHEDPACLLPAKSLLATPGRLPALRPYAVVAVTRWGDEADAEWLSGLLDERTPVLTVYRYPRMETLELREIVLVSLILKAGESPIPYGLYQVERDSQLLFRFDSVDIQAPFSTASAIAKFRADQNLVKR